MEDVPFQIYIEFSLNFYLHPVVFVGPFAFLLRDRLGDQLCDVVRLIHSDCHFQ